MSNNFASTNSSSDQFSVYSCRFRKIHVYAWKGKNHQAQGTHTHTFTHIQPAVVSATKSHTATRMKNKIWNKEQDETSRNATGTARVDTLLSGRADSLWICVYVCFFFAVTLLSYSEWMRAHRLLLIYYISIAVSRKKRPRETWTNLRNKAKRENTIGKHAFYSIGGRVGEVHIIAAAAYLPSSYAK